MAVEIVDYGKDITTWQERHNALCSYENKIRKELYHIQESAVYIGYTLWDIENMCLYSTVYHQGIGDYYKNIYQYASQELDLPKTTTFNIMAVAKEFSKAQMGLKEKYKDYSFSQLVELLPMSEKAREYADPRMSVRDIRALKRGENVTVVDEKGYGRSVMLPNELIVTAVPTSEQKTELIGSSDRTATHTQKNSDIGTDSITSESTEQAEVRVEPQPVHKSIPTSEQTERKEYTTNREYLNSLDNEQFIKTLFDKYEDFYKLNFDSLLDEYEIDINAKTDLEDWLGAKVDPAMENSEGNTK